MRNTAQWHFIVVYMDEVFDQPVVRDSSACWYVIFLIDTGGYYFKNMPNTSIYDVGVLENLSFYSLYTEMVDFCFQKLSSKSSFLSAFSYRILFPCLVRSIQERKVSILFSFLHNMIRCGDFFRIKNCSHTNPRFVTQSALNKRSHVSLNTCYVAKTHKSLNAFSNKDAIEWTKPFKITYLRVKLQTVLFWTHLQGGSRARNVMIRVWNVTGTNIMPTTHTRVHWNLPILPILERKPSTLRVIVLAAMNWKQE